MSSTQHERGRSVGVAADALVEAGGPRALGSPLALFRGGLDVPMIPQSEDPAAPAPSHASSPYRKKAPPIRWLESTQGRSVGLSGPCANATAPPRHMPLWRVIASRAGQPNPTHRLRRATASIEGRVLSFSVTLGPPHSAGGAEIRLRHAMSHMHVQIPCVRLNSTQLNLGD